MSKIRVIEPVSALKVLRAVEELARIGDRLGGPGVRLSAREVQVIGSGDRCNGCDGGDRW